MWTLGLPARSHLPGGLVPSAWPHLPTGPAPCGQREGKGELWGRGHSRACLEGTGGDPAWVLRAHSGTWRGGAGSSVGAASGGGTAQATALATLLLLPSDRRGGPGAASVSIKCLLCRRPAVWTRIPGEQAGLQQTLGDAGPQGPLETRTCLPETDSCGFGTTAWLFISELRPLPLWGYKQAGAVCDVRSLNEPRVAASH